MWLENWMKFMDAYYMNDHEKGKFISRFLFQMKNERNQLEVQVEPYDLLGLYKTRISIID